MAVNAAGVHTIKIAARYLDDVDTSVNAQDCACANGWGDMSCYVFNSRVEPDLASSMRLYYLKMWADSELVRDFIPARRTTDGAVGMLDRVHDQFCGNIGTGEFIAP